MNFHFHSAVPFGFRRSHSLVRSFPHFSQFTFWDSILRHPLLKPAQPARGHFLPSTTSPKVTRVVASPVAASNFRPSHPPSSLLLTRFLPSRFSSRPLSELRLHQHSLLRVVVQNRILGTIRDSASPAIFVASQNHISPTSYQARRSEKPGPGHLSHRS